MRPSPTRSKFAKMQCKLSILMLKLTERLVCLFVSYATTNQEVSGSKPRSDQESVIDFFLQEIPNSSKV